MPTIEERFAEAFFRLKPKGRIVLGVSGGADSMALLGLLEAVGQKTVVAHFNHLLRGDESDGDERFVREQSEMRGLEFKVGRGDVRAEAKGISIEMAARKLRHAFLAEVARDVGGEIVLAHHADDQIELVLLRARRGIEGYGASGMREESVSPADSSVRVLRPLLHIRRQELREYLDANRIPFREDSTNAELTAQRNWIRHKTIPTLREHFGPQFETAILEHIREAQSQDDAWRRSANAWVSGDFSALPERLRKEIIVTRLERLGIIASGKTLEPILRSEGKTVTVAPGVFVRMDLNGRLTLVGEDQPISLPSIEVRLEKEGAVEFGGMKFSWSIKRASGPEIDKRNGVMTFDAARVGDVVTLRYPTTGDSVRLSGRSSTKPLMDVLGRNKIPRERRNKTIVATTQTGELFWVQGLRITDAFKVTDRTEQILEWRWQGLQNDMQ